MHTSAVEEAGAVMALVLGAGATRAARDVGKPMRGLIKPANISLSERQAVKRNNGKAGSMAVMVTRPSKLHRTLPKLDVQVDGVCNVLFTDGMGAATITSVAVLLNGFGRREGRNGSHSGGKWEMQAGHLESL